MSAPMTRKTFCGALAGSTVALLVQACGGGGSDSSAVPGPAPSPAPGGAGCTEMIAGNHGHVLLVATADLDSPTDKAYDIQGGAGHNHTVTLTVAQLRALKAGTTVSVTSSTTDAHDHGVTIICA